MNLLLDVLGFTAGLAVDLLATFVYLMLTRRHQRVPLVLRQAQEILERMNQQRI